MEDKKIGCEERMGRNRRGGGRKKCSCLRFIALCYQGNCHMSACLTPSHRQCTVDLADEARAFNHVLAMSAPHQAPLCLINTSPAFAPWSNFFISMSGFAIMHIKKQKARNKYFLFLDRLCHTLTSQPLYIHRVT